MALFARLKQKIAAVLLRKKTSPFVRPAQQNDAPLLSALYAEGGFSSSWTIPEFEALLADRAVIADVLCDPARPLRLYGFSLSRSAADEAEILTIVLSKSVRGRGWARVLLHQHATRLAASGIATLYLEVEEDNRPARALYEGMGFETLGKRPGYYKKRDGSTAHALVMRCRLDRL